MDHVRTTKIVTEPVLGNSTGRRGVLGNCNRGVIGLEFKFGGQAPSLDPAAWAEVATAVRQ
jgi:hypothetical protein